jgi:hypothetical protein
VLAPVSAGPPTAGPRTAGWAVMKNAGRGVKPLIEFSELLLNVSGDVYGAAR